MSDPNSDPHRCPFCDSDEVFFSNGYVFVSKDPADGTDQFDLDEYQCKSEDCGRSFWT